jgi:hypothetical protein
MHYSYLKKRGSLTLTSVFFKGKAVKGAAGRRNGAAPTPVSCVCVARGAKGYAEPENGLLLAMEDASPDMLGLREKPIAHGVPAEPTENG